jgi:cytochrome P450
MSWIFALPLPVFEAVRKVQRRCDGYGDIAVTNARGEGSVKKANIFSALFADNEKGSDSVISDKDLANEATGFIVAGSGTTAITLTYLVWSVLRHPAIQQNLEEEVLGLDEDFTDAELEKLPVLNAIIDETLRLYGAAPGSLPRIVPAGGATLGGYFIPGGTTVCTQAYTLHRDEETFANAMQ